MTHAIHRIDLKEAAAMGKPDSAPLLKLKAMSNGKETVLLTLTAVAPASDRLTSVAPAVEQLTAVAPAPDKLTAVAPTPDFRIDVLGSNPISYGIWISVPPASSVPGSLNDGLWISVPPSITEGETKVAATPLVTLSTEEGGKENVIWQLEDLREAAA